VGDRRRCLGHFLPAALFEPFRHFRCVLHEKLSPPTVTFAKALARARGGMCLLSSGRFEYPSEFAMSAPTAPVYEVRSRKDKCGVNLISDALPFGCLWYGEPNAVSNAVDYAKHRSRSHDAVIRVYDSAGNVIETHEHAGDFKEP
jgi:hypothetical protein